MTDITKHPLYLAALQEIERLKDEIAVLSKTDTIDLRPWLNENVEGPVVLLEPGDLDEAIVGIVEDHSALIYDYHAIIRVFAKEMTWDDAVEWVDYNTIRGIPYMGEGAPIVIIRKEDICD